MALVRNHVRTTHRPGLRGRHDAAQRGNQAGQLLVQYSELLAIVSSRSSGRRPTTQCLAFT